MYLLSALRTIRSVRAMSAHRVTVAETFIARSIQGIWVSWKTAVPPMIFST